MAPPPSPASPTPESPAPASPPLGPARLPADVAVEPSWYLHRPRLDPLLERLQRPNARVLTLWDAAGSGKTTLMAAWARRLRASHHRVDWFTGRDLRGVGAGSPQRPHRPDGPKAATPRRFVFIDDLPLTADPAPGDLTRPFGPTLTDLVDTFAGDAGEVRLVVSGRSRPIWATAPLQAAGVLVDCGDDTLAFTLEETVELAAHQGMTLSAGDAAALWRHTGGWATALALAMTWQHAKGQDHHLARFDGDTRAVADYLAAEVVAGLAAGDHEVLVRSAVGEVVPLELAVAVTDRSDAGAVLDRLARRNTLIGREPAADGGEDYRYHPILLAYLQAEARRRDAVASTARHVLASRWYSGRADGAGAVTQSLLASEPEVVEMIERFGLDLTLAGSTDLVESALAKIQNAGTSPAGPVALVLRLLLDAPHGPASRRARRLLDAADAWVSDHPHARDEPALARWAAVVDIMHALLATDQSDIDNRLRALRTDPVESARDVLAIDLLAVAAEGRCLDELGRPRPAQQMLSEVAQSARTAGFEWLFVVASDLAATAAAHSGDWVHVAMLENQMAAAASAVRPMDHVRSTATLYAMIGRYERCQPCDPVVLDELVTVGEEHSDAGVSVPARVLALLARSGSTPRSRYTLDRLTLLMREVGAEHPRALSLCSVPLLELSAALDGRAEAHGVVRLVERVLGDDSLEAALLRFLLLPPGRPPQPAEARLRAAAVEERSAWRGSTIVSSWVALAVVAERAGRHVEAQTRLLRALRLAGRFGAERAFFTVGGEGVALLRSRQGRLGDLDDVARHILQCADEDRADARSPEPRRRVRRTGVDAERTGVAAGAAVPPIGRGYRTHTQSEPQHRQDPSAQHLPKARRRQSGGCGADRPCPRAPLTEAPRAHDGDEDR